MAKDNHAVVEQVCPPEVDRAPTDPTARPPVAQVERSAPPPAQTGSGRPHAPFSRRKAITVLALDGFIILCVMVLVELALQRWAPRYAQHLFDAEYTGWNPVLMNEHGFRGTQPPPAKADGELRILAMGDSVTFGTAVAASDTWSEQLAAVLSDERQAPVVAMNSGLPAIDLRQMRLCFVDDWSAHSPEVVVLVLTGNMVSLGWIRRNDPVEPPHNGFIACGDSASPVDQLKTQARRAVKCLALPSFLSFNAQRVLYHIGLLTHNVDPEAPYGVLLAHGWRQGGLCSTVPEEAWSILAEDLANLRDTIQAAGADLLVTYAPPRFTLSQARWDNEKSLPLHRMTIEPWARAAEICRQLGVQYVDAHTALRAATAAGPSEPLYVQFDYTHWSPAGHCIVAEALAGEISTHHR